ncbi:response regulator transcription factor [Emticicia soli]|uniref:Response regulator transcription factor n=1 Tax=Emticicia soli TaxID=2027878 RepID=A0ABW5JC35_9BACT
MEKKTSITFLEYLDKIKNPDEAQYNYAEQIKEVKIVNNFISKFSGVVFVADFQTGTYPFMGEGIKDVLGHPLEAIQEGGMNFIAYYLQVPKLIDNKCMEEQFKLYSNLKDKPLADIRFKMNAPITDGERKTRYFSQHIKFILKSNDGHPLGFYGYCTKVPIAEEKKVTQHIEFLNKENNEWQVYSSLEFYLEVDENKLLSKREIEILKWISEGLSSEAIATKLYISVHTVRTHRKNMLKRTNSTNSADLIRYGIEHKLI